MKSKKIMLIMPAIIAASALVGCGNNVTTSKVRVTFSPDYENATVTTVEVDKDAKVSEPAEKPVREGYTFNGWRVAPADSSEKYNFENSVSQDLILYGSWTENSPQPTPSTSILSVSNFENSYYVGDKLDLNQIVVSEVDSTGKATPVDPKNLEYSYKEAFTEVGTKAITVTNKASGAKGIFTVNVLNDYEVDADRYAYAMYNFFYGNEKIDITNVITYGTQTPSTTNLSYKRNGLKEYYKNASNEEYYSLYDNFYYWDIIPCKTKDGQDASVYGSYSNEYSKFTECMKYDIGMTLDPFYYYELFELKDNNVYQYVYNYETTEQTDTITYNLKFNRGNLIKVIYDVQNVNKLSEEHSEHKTATINIDSTFSDEIFKDPVDSEFYYFTVDDIVSTSTNVLTTTIHQFNKGTEMDPSYIADGKFITPLNVKCSVYYYDNDTKVDVDNVFSCVEGTEKLTIEGVETDAKTLKVTLDFTDSSLEGKTCYYDLSYLWVTVPGGTYEPK